MVEQPADKLITRRQFLKKIVAVAGGAVAVGGGIAAFKFDTYDLKITNVNIPIADLPDSFSGFRIAHMTDFHCRDGVRYEYLKRVAASANSLKPDIIVLTGDYVSHERKDIPPVMELIDSLRAKYGKLAVLGNHDHWTDAAMTREYLRKSGAVDLTNTNVLIGKGGEEICFAGVGDVWEDTQKIDEAYHSVPENIPRILLSHNPDYAEVMPAGYRTDFMISGHTHGGQVVLPLYGAPILPSDYGQKYASGLVEGPHCRVYISRGIGFIHKFRWNCRPELPVFTLVKA